MPSMDDPEIAIASLRWALDQAYRPGDCMHLVHVVKCMVQRMEIYHGIPGTSLTFEDPGSTHHEVEDVARAKAFLRQSVVPILEARGAQHQMFLSLETLEAPPSAVADIIFRAADDVDAALLVLGANRKPVTEEDVALGKVAQYALQNSKRPLVLVRPFQPAPVLVPDAN